MSPRITILSILALVGLVPGATAAPVPVVYSGPVPAEARVGPRCATTDPDPEEMALVDTLLGPALGRRTLETRVQTEVVIPLAFHVIHDGAAGFVDESAIAEQVDVLNDAFNRRGFRFELASLEYHAKKKWFIKKCAFGKEKAFKRKVAVDPATTLNVYTCEPIDGTLGWAYFPWWFDEDDWWNGVVIHWGTLPGGWAVPYDEGDTLVHEVGHYVGLYHTFEGGCEGRGDEVDDTPPQQSPNFGCPAKAPNTCRGGGRDPIENYMNYTDDSCLDEFTKGQRDRGLAVIETFRPTLWNNGLGARTAEP